MQINQGQIKGTEDKGELTIGMRIQNCRKELGLSQEALGEALGVSRQAVSKWEADAAIPDIDKLIAMSRLFHARIGWLLGVEEADENTGKIENLENQGTDEKKYASGVADAEGQPSVAAGEPSEGSAYGAGESAEKRKGIGKSGTNGEGGNESAEIYAEKVAEKLAEKYARPRHGKLIALVAVIAFVLISTRIGHLQSEVESLKQDMYYMNGRMSEELGALTGRMVSILNDQNSPISGQNLWIVSYDLKNERLSLTAEATLREWSEDAEYSFLVTLSDGENREAEAKVAEGAVVTAEAIEIPMDSSVSLALKIEQGGDTRLVRLGSDMNFSAERFAFDTTGSFWNAKIQESLDPTLSDESKSDLRVWDIELGEYTVWIDSRLGAGMAPNRLSKAELCVFMNRETAPMLVLRLDQAPELMGEDGHFAEIKSEPGYTADGIRCFAGDTLETALRLTDRFGNVQYSLITVYRPSEGKILNAATPFMDEDFDWQPGAYIPDELFD